MKINELKRQIKRELQRVNRKYDHKDFLSLLSFILFASLGIVQLPALPLNSLAMIVISLGLLKTHVENKKRKGLKEKEISHELEHINIVEKEGLDVSSEANAKRKDELVNLALSRKTQDRKLLRDKTNSKISLFGLGLSAVAIPFSPVIGLVSSVVFAGINVYTESKLTKTEEEYENLVERMNNIHNDLELIREHEKGVHELKIEEQPIRVNNNVEKKSATTSFNKNESIVQQYLDMMESDQEQDSGDKIKIKK